MGSDHSNFAVAAKKSLSNGADLHIKTDLTGITDVAHVSVSFTKNNDFEMYIFWKVELKNPLERIRWRVQQRQADPGRPGQRPAVGQGRSRLWRRFRVFFVKPDYLFRLYKARVKT